MSIKLTLKKTFNTNKVKNFVFFTNEEFNISGLSKSPVAKFSNQISKTINSSVNKNKDFFTFNLNHSQKIFLIKIKKNQSSLANEKIGAKFYNFALSNAFFNISFFEQNIIEISSKSKYFFDEFILGAKLKSYIFEKYKTKKNNKNLDIELIIKNNYINFDKNKRFNSIVEGSNFAKDLVSEP